MRKERLCFEGQELSERRRERSSENGRILFKRSPKGILGNFEKK